MPEVSDQQVEPVAPEESGTATGVSAEQAELLASQFKAVWEVEATDSAPLARDAAVAPVVPVQSELLAAGAPSAPEPAAAGLAENARTLSVEPPGAVATSAETEPFLGKPRRLSHQTMIGLAPVSVSPEPHLPQASAEPQVALAPAVLGSETTLPSSEPAAVVVVSPPAAQSVQQSLFEPPLAAPPVATPAVATPPVANLAPRPLSGWPEPEVSGQVQQQPLPVARVVTSFDDDLDVGFRPRSSGRKWVTVALIGGICVLLAVATKLLTANVADTEIPTRSQAVEPTPQSARRAAQPTETAPDTNRGGDVDRSPPNAARESGTRPQTSRRGRARTDTTVSSAPPAARWRRPRAAKAGAGRTAGGARQTARDSEPSTLPAPKGAAGSIVRETPF